MQPNGAGALQVALAGFQVDLGSEYLVLHAIAKAT